MTDDENAPPSAQAIARQNRLRDALRENLKRRKSQSRGRAGQAVEDLSGSATSVQPHTGERQSDSDPE
jgi:hypothetical protein